MQKKTFKYQRNQELYKRRKKDPKAFSYGVLSKIYNIHRSRAKQIYEYMENLDKSAIHKRSVE